MIQINPLKSYIDGGVRAAITTPPSASLVFDLPGKAIWVKGVKLKGTDHTYTFSHDNYITLTNTPDSNESEDIKIGVNTSALKNAIDTTYGVVSTTANGLAPKFTSGNKLAAAAATTYYFLGWAGSTLKWYQAPFRNIRINSETTDRLGVNNTDPLIISSGNGISVTWDSTNKKIVITNTKPDVNHNTHYTTMLYIGENNDTKANKNIANPYLKLFDDNTRRATFQIKAGNGIAVASDTNGNITITNSSPDVNHNTDERVRQVPKTDNINRPLMMINGNTSTGEQINTSMFSTGIYANASTKMITANGFIKAGSSDNYVLLGGGNHKALSDFSMAHSHPYLSFSSIYPSNTINLNDYFSSSTMYSIRYDYAGSSKIQNGPYKSDAAAIINFPTYSGTQVYFNYYNNDIKVRTHYNGHITNWATFITSENIGSQHVSYADSAGSVAWSNVTGKPFNWSGQSGQPTWLWGSNNGINYYVWNPSNFSVNYANSAGNAATATNAIVWKRTWERSHDCLVDIPSSETRIYMADSNTANRPCNGAGFIIGHGWDWGYGGAMIYQDFDGNDGGRLYTNSRQCDGAWQGWNKIAFVKEIPTVTNYYWANVKVSSSSSTSTSPTFATATAGQFIANNSSGPHFTGVSTSGNWAYLRLNNSTCYWDIATRNNSSSGGLWLARYNGGDNGIFVTASSTPRVGINTSSPSETLTVAGWVGTTGSTGWYNITYSGGIHMSDTTWVRVYNNKKFYVNNSEYNAIHSAGGVYVAGMVHSYSNYLKSTKNGKYVTIGPQNSSHAHYETDATVSHWFNKRVDVNGAIWRYNTNYGIDSDGYFYAKGIYANRDGSSTNGGVSLYSNSDPMTYGIAFRGTGTYGTYGGVTGDWATYLTTSDTTNRGWIFRRGSTNIASISGIGLLALNNGTTMQDYRINDNQAYYDVDSNIGIIEIAFPDRGSKCTMFAVDIDVYEYSSNYAHSKIMVGFYVYDNNTLHNYRVAVLGNYNKAIRLAYKGNKPVILLGATNTSWSYPKVYLTSVRTGYSNQASWQTGYTITGAITSESSYTSMVTPARSDVIYATNSTYATYASNYVMTYHHTANNTNYPLIWSNSQATTSRYSQLHTSYNHLYYNPANLRLTTNRYTGNYANLTLTSMRHIDAGLNAVSSDHELYIGYGAQTWTNKTRFYYSTGTTDSISSRTEFMQINSNGAYALTRFGVNGQNTGYSFYVNGTSLLNNTVRIQYNTPNLYIRNTVDTSYSIIRFGTNSNENASYIFQNGPSRTDDGGANTMTIRNNVGVLRLQNRVHIDTTGRIYPENTSSRRAGIYGVYDSYKIGHIWSMGASFMIPDDGANFGNLYGLAYKHTNNTTGGTMAGGHQAVWCNNGDPRAAMGYNGFWAAGGYYKNGSSDSYVLLGGGGHKLESLLSVANADTVDGLHYSSFLRKDTNDSTPYQYTFTKTNDHAIRVGTVRGTAVGSQTGEYIHLYERVAIGSPSGWGSRPAPSYGLATYGGAWLATDTGNVTIGGTNQLSSPWGSFNLIVGNNTNKVVIGYLNSSTNGVVVGGHNNALSAWAPLNIAGTTLYFRINETIKAIIDSNGNVGIGITSPGYKLHVAGDIYTTTGFKKNGSSNSYVLLGGGGHKAESSLSVNYATLAGNADTVDGQHFSYSNSSNSPTYLWATNSNGSSFLATRASISVNHATTATSLGQGALKHMCSLHATSTYNAYKITTDWHKSSNKMPTINIRGYAYGSVRIIDCDIVIYHYDNTACNYSLINKGSYPIRVWQAIENNVQVFYINPGEYYGMFNVFVYGGMGTDAFTSWTMTTVSTVSGTEISCSPLVTSITGNASSSTIASTVTVNNSDANSTYRMVWHSGNTLYGTNNIYCNPSSDQIYSAGFRHVSYNSASYLLRSDGGAAAFNWSGQSGQPTWLWGGNSQHTYYVYNPSNFNVNSAAVLRGNASNPNNSHPGHGAKVFYSWNTGQAGNDTSGYSNGITIGSNPSDTAYGFQIVQNMWDDRTYTRRYNGGWQSWKTLAWTSDIPTVTNYYWANVKVSASSSTSTSPTFQECYANGWFRSTGNNGWYNPTHGSHIHPNNTTTYGNLVVRGAKSGYTGINLGNSANHMTVMSTDTSHGLYCDNYGWEFYFNRSNGGVGIRTSSITKNFNVNGQSYLSSNVWIGTTSGGEMLNVGGWVNTIGNSGWYNSTYLGGLYMTDTDYIRVYNSKRVYNPNTSQYAFYTAGGMTALGHMYSNSSACSWLSGQNATNAALNIGNATDTDSYWPWIRQTNTSLAKWFSVGTLNNSLYFIGSSTSRTANNYDYGFRMDFSNGYLYGNFSGYLSGTASYVSVNNSDANSTYRMIWHSGNTLYSTGGIYCNPSTDYLYASSMQTSNWFRSTGLTGWYNETYGGGWYMNDVTWIRTHNNKGIYTSTGTIYNAGHAWLATSSGYNVGIGTTSPSYKLHVSGDGYSTGWFRSNNGLYCEGTGVHFTHNNSLTSAGEIDITSNNEFCWGSSNGALYFNYRGVSRGKTVTSYVWNAGNSSSYASHTTGHITLGNSGYLIKRVGCSVTWVNGRNSAIVRQTSADGYSVVVSSKTVNGSWEIGNYTNNGDSLYFTHITDSNYNSGNNTVSGQVYFNSSGSIYANNLNASNTVYAEDVNANSAVYTSDVYSDYINVNYDISVDNNINADGVIYATHFYENSDIRYKKILRNLSINSNIIANLPLFDFEWVENNTIGTGTSALAVQQILPNLVSGTDKLTLDYGVLGTIAGITACKELVKVNTEIFTLKSELQELKEKVKLLEDKLRKYENI